MFRNGCAHLKMAELMSMTEKEVADHLWLLMIWLKKINTTIHDNRRFTISELSEQYPQTTRTGLYETVTDRLGYRKFCARWVPKVLSEQHQTQQITSALDFLTHYNREGESFLDRIETG